MFWAGMAGKVPLGAFLLALLLNFKSSYISIELVLSVTLSK